MAGREPSLTLGKNKGDWMRLFPEVLASFATSCDGWEWYEDAWRPHRMPAIMRPLYEQPPNAKVRMQCTTGVRLRFLSDTAQLWIQLRYGVSARPKFKGVLLVDGQTVDPAGYGPDEATPLWEGTIYQGPTDQRVRLFDIWLPHICQADVVEIQIDDDSVMEPAEPLPIRWLMYGDSITQGMVSSLPTTSAFGIASLACQAEVLNLGIGGAKNIPELAKTIPSGLYDLVSIAYGTNDFNQGKTLQEYEANTRALVTGLLEAMPGVPILLISALTWVGRTGEPNAIGIHLDQYRQVLEPLADLSPLVKLIDGTTLVPDDPSFFVDNVHPNDKGFAVYGQQLAKHAKEALQAVQPQ